MYIAHAVKNTRNYYCAQYSQYTIVLGTKFIVCIVYVMFSSFTALLMHTQCFTRESVHADYIVQLALSKSMVQLVQLCSLCSACVQLCSGCKMQKG